MTCSAARGASWIKPTGGNLQWLKDTEHSPCLGCTEGAAVGRAGSLERREVTAALLPCPAAMQDTVIVVSVLLSACQTHSWAQLGCSPTQG